MKTTLCNSISRWMQPLAMLCGIAGAVVLCPGAFAQTNAGSIVGTVRDSSGAVVAGARVDVTNDATNVKVSFTTNGAGEYVALQLVPGTYTVESSRAGFQAAVRTNVRVDVQARVQVDFALAVGKVQQQVEVSDTTATLETQSAEVGGVLSNQQVNQLPLNGRQYDKLVLTEPGTYEMLTAASHPAEGRFSSNGNLELQNYFQLDGIDNNTYSENLQEETVQSVIPPPDALQEYVLQTRTYSTEFGTAAGAVVNASTKSGTNHFNGDVWEYIENSDLDSNTYFNNYGGVPKGHFSQNQFGGTFGGPIRRNRTFFFAAWESLLSSQATTELTVVPTPNMKNNGDFTAVSSSHPLTAEANGQSGCITGNVVSPGCIDSVGQALIKLYPDPSPALSPGGNVEAWNGSDNYQYVAAVPTNNKSLDARIDHTINGKNQLMGRYALYYSLFQVPLVFPNPVAGNEQASNDILHSQSVSLGWTYTPASTLVNTVHFGFLREFSHELPLEIPLGVSDASQYGLTGIPASPYDSGLPPIYVSDFTSLGTKDYRPGYQVAQVYQIVDNVYKLIGKHSLQFGYDYHQYALNFFDIEAPQGTVTASGIYTNTNGFGAADLLLGDVSSTIYDTSTEGQQALEVNNYIRGNSIYGQDTWRATPKLTVNYGLRYELYYPFWVSRENRTVNFSPANGGELVDATGGNGLYGRVLIHPDRIDFAPRGGFAYHVFPHIVLRGGYGIFHQFIQRIGSESMLQLNPPWLLNDFITESTGSTTPVFQLKNGYPAATLMSVGVSLPNLQIRAQDPNERTPYVEQTSFGPEIQISNNTLLNITYVGNWARKENRLRNENQGVLAGYSGTSPLISFPYANLNTEGVSSPVLKGAGTHAFLEVARNDGNLDYDGLDVALKREFTHGLMFQLSYTWSHGMADYEDNLTETAEPQDAYDYGFEMSNSEQDTRQRFVGSGTWELPIGRNGWVLKKNDLASKLLGGWQVNTITTLQTGIPFTVTAPDESDTGSNHSSYPNLIGNPFSETTRSPSRYAGSNAPGIFINVAAYADPVLGQFGNVKPRAYYGPGLIDSDISLFKSFPLGEARRFEFRTEFFNAFNHPSFGNPNSSVSSPSAFGKVTSTTIGNRTIQFAGKIFF